MGKTKLPFILLATNNIKKLKPSHVHGLEHLILLRSQYYREWSTNSMQFLSQSQRNLFSPEIENPILKFTWNFKEPWIYKTVLKKENKGGGLTLLDFKT